MLDLRDIISKVFLGKIMPNSKTNNEGKHAREFKLEKNQIFFPSGVASSVMEKTSLMG
jgi:hypothetical protein